MKRVLMVVCWLAILAVPAGVFAAPAADGPRSSPTLTDEKDKEKDKDKDVKDKSVPAPQILVLLGAAGVVAGASKFWLSRRRT